MACHCRWLFAFLCLLLAPNHLNLIPPNNSSSSSATLFAAAYEDRPFYTTPQYSNITHRTPVCDRFLQLANGTKEIRYLLEGLELSVGVLDHQNDVFLRLNRTDKDPNNWSINETDPGIVVHLLDELAARGRFTWRNSFALVPPPETKRLNPATGFRYSWTDVLLDSVERYDVSMGEWVHTQERREYGISFPVGWFDASTILIQNQVLPVLEFNLYSFLLPFSKEVWFLCCATIFFSGIVYWWLDKIEFPTHKIKTVIANTYFSVLLFTQHHAYEDPQTHAKRIFGLSAAVWALCTVTFYTANLASVLVAQRIPVIWAESLEDAQQQQIDLCVRAGAALHDELQTNFAGIRFQEDKDFDQVYESLRNGRCKMMASRKADFDAFQKNQQKNPDCTLEWVGRVQSNTKAGSAVLVDTSNYCTSLIHHVLDVLMHELLLDGVVEHWWEDHLLSLENKNFCGLENEEKVLGYYGEVPLGMADVGGVFVFHAFMIVISIVVTLIESPWRRRRRREKALREAKLSGALEPTDGRPSMEREYSIGSQGSNQEEFVGEGPLVKPSMERLHSMRRFGGRASMGARYSYMDTFAVAAVSGKPSMERLHSIRPSGGRRPFSAASNSLDDSDRSNYAPRYSGRHSGYSTDTPLRSSDGVLQCIQLMQAKLEQLKRIAEEQNQRRSAGSSSAVSMSGMTSPGRARRKTPVRTLSIIKDSDEEDSSAEDDW